MIRIAIIPARIGSKRIPEKNIKPFHGKPIIAWSIEAAVASDLFDHIVVSTDDNRIKAIAEQYGAEVPFMRPAHLADDHVALRPVVQHALAECEQRFGEVEYVCTLFPTAPLLTATEITAGFRELIRQDADYAFSVTEFPYPIQRALHKNRTKGVSMFFPEFRTARSQDLEPAYHDAGQFYWGRKVALMEDRPTFSDNSVPIVLPRHRVCDIDTETDWLIAEKLFELL